MRTFGENGIELRRMSCFKMYWDIVTNEILITVPEL